jgi:hypothetical protein
VAPCLRQVDSTPSWKRKKPYKGITIYRYGSKKDQVLSLPGQLPEATSDQEPFVTVDSEYSGGCVWCSRA